MRLKTQSDFALDPTALGPEVDAFDVPAPDPLSLIDDALTAFVGRSLVTSSEVVDRLLDLRTLLALETRFVGHTEGNPT